MNEYYIAWWNVENLFDINNASERPEYLQKKLDKELEGWDETVLNKKLTQLAKIIKQMNNNQGPDILGVCEIENRNVLVKLVKHLSELHRTYDIVHADTKDGRGIDVAFIYDNEKFRAKEKFSHHVLKRTATRDIFQVTFETAPQAVQTASTQQSNELILIGNHWPSRMGGEYKSEPYRILAAETLAYWHERIVEIKGEGVNIIVMGDFNDEPYNRSIREYALSWRYKNKVVNARKPKFHNLMWDVMGRKASFYFGGQPNLLDQVWVSKGFYMELSKFEIDDNVEIFMPPEMISSGYPDPVPFKRPSHKEYTPEGYSDHYPVWFIVKEN